MQEFVTIQDSPDEGTSIGQKMVSEGLLRAERRRDKRLVKLVRVVMVVMPIEMLFIQTYKFLVHIC